MNSITWIIVIVLILFIVFLYLKNSENFFASTDASNNITANNITASGTLCFGNSPSICIGKDQVATDYLSATNINASGKISGMNIYGVGIQAGDHIISEGEVTGAGITSRGVAQLNSDVYVGGNICLKKKNNEWACTNGDSGGSGSIESIQNIASLYNAGNLTATNINATNNITATNINSPNGTISGAKVYGTQIHSGNDILADGRVTTNYITSKGVASLNSDVYVGGTLCIGNPSVCINRAQLQTIKQKLGI
jgi:hypothetical protein